MTSSAQRPRVFVLTDPRDDATATLKTLEKILFGAGGHVGVVLRHDDPALAAEVAALAAPHGAPCFAKVVAHDARAREGHVHVGTMRREDPVPARPFTASAHDVSEAALAANADAVFVGPIYDVPGKGAARGVRLLGDVRRVLPETPLYALGGLDVARVSECVAAGADGVAVIRAVMAARDPALAVHALVAAVDRARQGLS